MSNHSATNSPEDETQSALVPDPTLPGRSSKHYRSLDGLRGVAILSVLAFHGFLPMHWKSPTGAVLVHLPLAGWSGVDLFFVLSGFLITGILIDSRSSSRFFKNFYARRMLRIFPIYYLFLAVMLIILPRLKPFNTPDLQALLHYQGWMWTYLTNIGFIVHQKAWASPDWLDMNHLWSLAVEEQFYIFWPLVVFFISRRSLKTACGLLIVLSLAARCTLWLLHQRNGAIYFPTFCRLDGVAMGALAAILIRERSAAEVSRLAKRCALIAGAMVVAVIVWRRGWVFTDSPTVVFGVSAVSFFSMAMLLLAIEPTGTLARLLTWRPLREIGKYSYALYLFHAPLRAPLASLVSPDLLASSCHSEVVGYTLFVILFGTISFVAAVISWHLFEKHWLKLKRHFDYMPPSLPQKAVVGPGQG